MTTNFTLSSADAENGMLPYRHFANIFGCSGDNLSPQLSWQGAPEGTKSFVVTMYDPDAPTGSGWWHWVAIDIPASVTSLTRGAGSEKGTMPQTSVQTNTDMGAPGYGGACPPVGETHRYVITVKALNVEKLAVPPNATGALVGLLSNMHSLGQATLTLSGTRPA